MNLQHTASFSIVIATAVMLFAGCNVGSFTFTEESNEILVEGKDLLGQLSPFDIPLEINLEQQLEEQDASGARSVHMIELYFEMTDDTEEPDFDFIDTITIEVDSDSEPKRELAWRDPVPEGQSRFELDIDEELDLKPYAEEGVTMTTSVSGTTPDDDARFKVYATFRVHVV